MDSVAQFVSQFNSFAEFRDYILSHPQENPMLYNIVRSSPELIDKIFNSHKAIADAEHTGDYNAALGEISSQGTELSAEKEKYLDNLISNQRTIEARDYDTQMRDTSLLSAGSQLEQLGLSTSNVIQTGGVASNGVLAAGTSKHSAAQMHQQERINNFNQKLNLAKSLVSTAGSMASSGIYGAAIGAVKHSASALAASAAHSGLDVLNKWNGKGNGPLLSGQLADEWSKLPGAY